MAPVPVLLRVFVNPFFIKARGGSPTKVHKAVGPLHSRVLNLDLKLKRRKKLVAANVNSPESLVHLLVAIVVESI